MTYDGRSRIYTAGAGFLFVRKADGKAMGRSIQLGDLDSVENYEERAFSEGEVEAMDRRNGRHGRRPGDMTGDRPGDAVSGAVAGGCE